MNACMRLLTQHKLWLVMALAVLLAEVWIAHHVFGAEPITQDEYNMLYQARIFARGNLAFALPEELKIFGEVYMIRMDGRLFTKHPPGFPALLSLAVLGGFTAWLNPLLIAATSLLLMQAVRQCTSWLAATATGMLFIANAYTLGYGASLYPHALCLCLCTAALLNWLHFQRTGSLSALRAAGIACALLALTRPVDAAALIMALTIGLALAKPRIGLDKRLTTLLIPAFCGIILLMAYNWVQSGNFGFSPHQPWTTGDFLLDPIDANGFVANTLALFTIYVGNFVKNVPEVFLNRWVAFMGLGAFALIIGGLWFAPRYIKQFCALHMLALALLYNFNITLGYTIYGSRYWYSGWTSVLLLAAFALERVRARYGTKGLCVVTGLVVAAQVAQASEDLAVYKRRAQTRAMIQAQLQEQCPENTVVSITPARMPEPNEGWPRYISAIDLKRNAFLEGSRLFLVNRPPEEDIMKYFPTFTPCIFTLNTENITPPPPVATHFNWHLRDN